MVSADPRRAPQNRRPEVALDAVRSRDVGLPVLAEAARGCQACDLWERATQTVFGAGPADARIVLVGEQPGDAEDLAGQPFVGPAGRLLDRALDEAKLDRERIFVTNVVKHFKWRPTPGGKRRLHERPSRAEVAACRPWVDAEILSVKPIGIGILGATAAQAMLEPDFSVTRDHGLVVGSKLAELVVATIHPSAILRARDAEAREAALEQLVGDLRLLAPALSAT
jgi:DNA polymerase